MKCVSFGVMAVLVLAPRASRAQLIAATVAQAEVEGAALPQGPAPTVVAPTFATRPFGGTSERRCVQTVPDDSLPGGSLRSGDFIARTHFTGWFGLHGGQEHKIVFMPFHGAADRGDTLLLRAVRIGSPSDSLRQTIAGLARSGTDYGYPSLVRFPAAGRWLVVATAGKDWGCFVLRVDA